MGTYVPLHEIDAVWWHNDGFLPPPKPLELAMFLQLYTMWKYGQAPSRLERSEG